MIQVCPLHGDADDVRSVPLDAGVWQYTCTRKGHVQPGPYTWESAATGDDLDGAGNDGVMEALGLYDSLTAAVVGSPGWVEYGLLEYRFSQASPGAFMELVATYGHTNYGPKRYTASSLLGGCLGRLANARGVLAYRPGVSTGYWSYNSPGSFYAMPPAMGASLPAPSASETYADYALSVGEDPLSVAWWPGVWP